MNLDKLLRYKKILILGYGKEGKATHRFLRRYVPEASIMIADRRDGDDYLNSQDKADLVIKTPSLNKKFIKKPYTTASNIFFANVGGRTIGITGTKGKSTTSSLIHYVLSSSGYNSHLVGNIGNPMLDHLDKSDNKDDIYVIELSSYQLDDLSYSPDTALVLNLYEDHMNYHGTLKAYYRAKKNIMKYQRVGDFFIYNQNFEILRKWAAEAKSKAIEGVEMQKVSGCRSNLLGPHMLENISFAYKALSLYGVSFDKFCQHLKTFHPLPHRMQKLGTYRGIVFYDDGAATTPEAAIGAIGLLDNIDTVFLGGEDRGYDFEKLCRVLINSSVKNLVLFPQASSAIIRTLKKLSALGKFDILNTSSMEEAVKFAYKKTRQGRICLLSPAAPSYSLWRNFDSKGKEYLKYIKKYSK